MSKAVIEALEAHDLDRMAKLLAAGEDPNPVVEDGRAYDLLYSAVSGADPFFKSKYPDAIDAVVLLLRHGAEVDAKDPDYPVTALMRAAQIRHAECARILLAAGANPSVIDDEGETPLRLFTKVQDVETVQLLLRCGADMYRCGGMDGMNPFGFAVRLLNVDLVRVFLAQGADPMVPDLDRMTVIERLETLLDYDAPDTPEKWERFHTIRRLLGVPEP